MKVDVKNVLSFTVNVSLKIFSFESSTFEEQFDHVLPGGI